MQGSEGGIFVGYLRMQVLESVLSTFENGADLNRKHEIAGKRHVANYPVVEREWELCMAKTIKKLVDTGKDIGPMRWDGDVEKLPWDVVRINAKFAVPYKEDRHRASTLH